MFRHQANHPSPSSEKLAQDKKDGTETESPTAEVKDVSLAAMRELLEKNLKWSQIIYEQNRRINNKLLWGTIGSWVRVLVIVVPLILAIIFLPPLIGRFLDKYTALLGGIQSGKATPNSLEDILKLLPINSAQTEQLKAMLK